MGKKFLFLLVFIFLLFIFINSCTESESEKIFADYKKTEIRDSSLSVKENKLGDLCTGKDECIDFCLNNRGRCEEYCRGEKIVLCSVIFPPEQPGSEGIRGYKNILDREWSHGECKGNGTVNFGVSPMNPDDILVIIPMGDMIGGHVTPIDHLYFYPTKPHLANIYAPANGTIVYISAANKAVGTGQTIPTTYTVIIEHTCDFYTLLGLLDDLSPKIKEKTGIINEQIHTRIPVTQGEILGNIEENSLDYNIFYTKAPLKQWIFPEHYTELGKAFIVDPFDYYIEPVRSKLLEKNLRTIHPLGGKFDHDIDGTLSGSWFEENTNWYEGIADIKIRYGPYWKTHISFSPDPVDPNGFVISLGDFNGEARQFGVKGNSPKPKDVKVSSTPTLYELVDKGYIDQTGKPWTFGAVVHGLRIDIGPQVQGVVLVQLIEDRKIKFELFPGKTANEVNDFTDKAKIYER